MTTRLALAFALVLALATSAAASPITFVIDFLVTPFHPDMFPVDTPATVTLTVDSEAVNRCADPLRSGHFNIDSASITMLGQTFVSGFPFYLAANQTTDCLTGPPAASAEYIWRFAIAIPTGNQQWPIGNAAVSFRGPFDGGPPTSITYGNWLNLNVAGSNSPVAQGWATNWEVIGGTKTVPEPSLLALAGVGLLLVGRRMRRRS